MWACDRASLSGVPSWLKGKASYRESSLSDWRQPEAWSYPWFAIWESKLLAKDGGEGYKEPGSVLIPQAAAPALFFLFPGIWLHQKNEATWVSVMCGYTDICWHECSTAARKYCHTCSVSRRFFINSYAWLFLLCFLLLWFFPRVEILAFFQSFVEMKRTMESYKYTMKINFIWLLKIQWK